MYIDCVANRIQAVGLEDMGSTHGTFASRRKLEKNIPYYLNQDELITFGTTVTNDLRSYHDPTRSLLS